MAVLDYADAYFAKTRLPARFDNWPTSSLRDPLPDPLVFADGSAVAKVEDWPRRREEIIALLMREQYGRMPEAPQGVRAEITSETPVMDGRALDRRVTLTFTEGASEFSLRLGMLVPTREGKFGVVIKNDVAIGHVPIAERLIESGIAVVEYLRTDLDLG